MYIVPVDNLNVELMKNSTYSGGRGRSGQTLSRHSRAGSTFRWVGSGPRKVTRGQL